MFCRLRLRPKFIAVYQIYAAMPRILPSEYCSRFSSTTFARTLLSSGAVFMFSPLELNRLHGSQDTPCHSPCHGSSFTNWRESNSHSNCERISLSWEIERHSSLSEAPIDNVTLTITLIYKKILISEHSDFAAASGSRSVSLAQILVVFVSSFRQ